MAKAVMAGQPHEAELRRLDEIKFTECKINGGDDCGSLDSAGDDDAAASPTTVLHPGTCGWRSTTHTF